MARLGEVLSEVIGVVSRWLLKEIRRAVVVMETMLVLLGRAIVGGVPVFYIRADLKIQNCKVAKVAILDTLRTKRRGSADGTRAKCLPSTEILFPGGAY